MLSSNLLIIPGWLAKFQASSLNTSRDLTKYYPDFFQRGGDNLKYIMRNSLNKQVNRWTHWRAETNMLPTFSNIGAKYVKQIPIEILKKVGDNLFVNNKGGAD